MLALNSACLIQIHRNVDTVGSASLRWLAAFLKSTEGGGEPSACNLDVLSSLEHKCTMHCNSYFVKRKRGRGTSGGISLMEPAE